MKYRDVLIMRSNLDHVNTTEGSAKFLYVVCKNKARLDTVIRDLDSLRKPSEAIEEFWRKLDEINKIFAATDESGTVEYTSVNVNGEIKKAYKKVIGEGNPESPYSKEVDKLREKFQTDIDKFEDGAKRYNKMLDEEVIEGDFRIFWIDFDIVPDGLNVKAMDGCLPFIKEIAENDAATGDKKEGKRGKKT